jgi:DNA-binding XRE family transcriptional regulator
MRSVAGISGLQAGEDVNQQDVADAIGISRRSVHAIEHGKPTAEVETVLRICAALGLIIEARS